MEAPEYQELLELLSTAFPGQEHTEQQQRLLEMSDNEAFAEGVMAALRIYRNIRAYPVEERRPAMARAIMAALLLSVLVSEHPENLGSSGEEDEEEESDLENDSSSEGTGL